LWDIVTKATAFLEITRDWSGLIAADVETYGERWEGCGGKLLGVSLSPERSGNSLLGIYIPFNVFEAGKWEERCEPSLKALLAEYLSSQPLVGHNFTYDKHWIDSTLGIATTWVFDTQIAWHLTDNPKTNRSYGLDKLETDLLGWPISHKKAYHDHLKSMGAKPTKELKIGYFVWLGELEKTAEYAAMDAFATMAGFKALNPFFVKQDYGWMLAQMMQYNLLLEKNSHQGILVDTEGLSKAHNRLLKTKQSAENRFKRLLKEEINELEQDWADRRIAEYKREYNKIRYANHPEEWKRFNLNSDKDKRELFYDKLKFHPVSFTDGGKPSVDGDSLKRIDSPFVAAYLKYEKANTLSTNFSGPYLHSVRNNRLHPGFNICGTVSYRLSGFKPYLLNAPFDEKAILRHLRCDPGYVGVHADLSAIEPTITAHYSEDESLLKVFGYGLGDVYLDLALELFPRDQELKDGYNPNIPISKETKRRFERQRKIAKVIQLAVQYTGTGHTVAKNLSKDGVPTTVEEADRYVSAYWRKFAAVAAFNKKLFEVNRQQGYLRNVIGRIIRVPDPNYKDLPNRFVQSSAHDVLVLWVLEISRMFEERGVEGKPILLDCHDSTSWQVPRENEKKAIDIYKEALDNINRRLGLCVTIKAEIKTFQTLAGLKAQE
jgi:DNA polymerase I-like protein with 3'-5' exonuclease and polymerase domains